MSDDVEVRMDFLGDFATTSDETANNNVDVDLEFLASNVGILEVRLRYSKL